MRFTEHSNSLLASAAGVQWRGLARQLAGSPALLGAKPEDMDEAALRKLAERNRGTPVAERLAAYLDHAELGEREPTLEEAAWAAWLARRRPT